MAGKRWGERGSVDDAPAGPSVWLSDLLGRWFEASRAEFGWAFDAWYDVPVGVVARALERGVVDRDALAALGASRFARRRTQDEAMADFELALDAAGASMGKDAADAARACVAAGFLNPTVSDPSWFGDARSLSRSMRQIYANASARRPPASSHALLLIDINVSWLDVPERAMALAAAAEEIHEHFPAADPVACLGEPRFAVLVHRHPGLAVGAESLRLAFEAVPLLSGGTKVFLVPLPESSAGVGRFVRELAGAQRPLQVRTYEPRTAAGGGPGAELLRAAVPISAVRPARRRRFVPAMVVEGSGMLSAAVAAIVFAIGVGQAVGPASVTGQTPTTQLFGLAPHVTAPVPAPTGPSPTPPGPEAAPVPEPEPTAADSVATARRTRAPVRPAAPSVETAPVPDPSALAAPVAISAPDASPGPAPEFDPCAALDEKDARRCERQMGRDVEEPAAEHAAGPRAVRTGDATDGARAD
ncbi:MAG TPA: hypothetical protein VI916_09395 [Acidimicrobiia bacterium]|nr:hypothetical protein [Acidimicrobiia bacterium]